MRAFGQIVLAAALLAGRPTIAAAADAPSSIVHHLADPGPRPPINDSDYDAYRGPGTSAVSGTLPVLLTGNQKCTGMVALYPSTAFTQWYIATAFRNEDGLRFGEPFRLPAGGPRPAYLMSYGKADSVVRAAPCVDWPLRFEFRNVPAGNYFVIAVIANVYHSVTGGYSEEEMGADGRPEGCCIEHPPHTITLFGEGYMLRSEVLVVEADHTYTLTPESMIAVSHLRR